MNIAPSTTRPDTTIRFGSDVVSAVLSAFGVEFAAFNPGATFRGIHDSFVNFRPAPTVIECCHEEISVAIAHGYAKAAGKPMVACVHNVVGLQHASMAIYNAWCDRAPVIVLGGTGPRDLTRRRPWIDWIHTALVQGQLVRDFVKWDDEPHNLASVPESLARAYRTAVSRPQGPVYVNFDVLIQESPVPAGYTLPDVSRFGPAPTPTVAPDELERLAAALAAAERPVILVEHPGRSDADLAALVSLAETLGAPVLDKGNGVGFPNGHPLDCSGAEKEVLADADFILAFEVEDLYGSLHRNRPGHGEHYSLVGRPQVAHVGLRELSLRAWATDFQRLQETDFPLVGDPAAAARDLALLLEGRIRPEVVEARRQAARQRHNDLRAGWLEQARQLAADRSGPVHPAALAHELGAVIGSHDFSLANQSEKGWERRLWNLDRPYRHLGTSGGGGLGYGMGACIGGALALARGASPKLVVNVQADGDMLFTPAALWTLAKYELPVLIVMDNNRTYFNSQNHARDIAERRGRPAENCGIGTTIDGPNVDFANLARSFGVWGGGPVERAVELRPVLEAAVRQVLSGRPALVDVSTLPVPY